MGNLVGEMMAMRGALPTSGRNQRDGIRPRARRLVRPPVRRSWYEVA